MDSAQLWALTPAIISVALVMFAVGLIAPKSKKEPNE